MNEIEVHRISSPAELECAFQIRRYVFLVEQKVPPDEEFDEHDSTALHVLATVDQRPAGTGRLVSVADHARIGRMAVLAEHRKCGVGRALLRELLKAAAERGIRRIVLHAQVQAIGFYESFGFSARGDIFEEAGIPHRVMELEL